MADLKGQAWIYVNTQWLPITSFSDNGDRDSLQNGLPFQTDKDDHLRRFHNHGYIIFSQWV